MHLKCQVSPGQFSNERRIEATDYFGESISGFVDAAFIDNGGLLVDLVCQDNSMLLIKLPMQTLDARRTVLVAEWQTW